MMLAASKVPEGGGWESDIGVFSVLGKILGFPWGCVS